jgi:hypothetical protein
MTQTELNINEQVEITGGGPVGCLASGALFAFGVFTLDPVAALGGIIGADASC